MDWPSLSPLSRLDRHRGAISYIVVTCSVLAAIILRVFLMPVLGAGAPLVTFWLAIIFSSWRLGFKGGAAATVLSALAAYFLFTANPHSLFHSKPVDVASFSVFLFEAFAVALLGQAQLVARVRADASAKVAAQTAALARQRESALAASEERLRLAIDGAHIGTWHWDIIANQLTWSETMRALLGRPTLDPTGYESIIEAVHPEDRETVMTTVSAAVESNTDFNIELRVIWPDKSIHWLVVRGRSYKDDSDSPIRMEGIGLDITVRKLAEQEAYVRARRASALNTISKAIRETRVPAEIQMTALLEMADTLRVDRCLAILLDVRRGKAKFVAEWHRPDLVDLRGEYSLADFDVNLDEIFPSASALVVPDVDAAEQLSSLGANMLRSMQIKALIDVPMSNQGEIIGVLGVYMAETARQWTPEEVSFVEAVASHLRAATESTRVLSEAQSRADRESLINKIGEVMRTSLDPEEIQEKAVCMLGEALGADRCYFALYDLTNSVVVIGRDWHRADLKSIHGTHPFNNTTHMFNELYSASSTSVVRDRDESSLSEQTIENMKGLQLRARLSVALADTTGMATLTAAMSETARDWMPEDIELLEKVASLLRSGVEMARVQQREHRIATDLQAALLPTPPVTIAGLEIGASMQAALDEAEIGGDFFDVFHLDDKLCALVIGDVSGKGLAAAGQLATIRNCLRTSIYLHPEPSKALTTLNKMVTANELLSGFVTAFVGIFDASSRVLSYVSCGHEPVLLRRHADQSIEELRTKGLPIGIDETVTYEQSTVKLNAGDTLLLYTDGLSEAGPSRQEMIETEGITRYFAAMADLDDPAKSAPELVDQVKAFANGVFRDDVCVLIVRCKEDGTWLGDLSGS